MNEYKNKKERKKGKERKEIVHIEYLSLNEHLHALLKLSYSNLQVFLEFFQHFHLFLLLFSMLVANLNQ